MHEKNQGAGSSKRDVSTITRLMILWSHARQAQQDKTSKQLDTV